MTRKEARFGMWLFLSSELVFFSGFFLLYAVLRFRFMEDFQQASKHMYVFLGFLNTVILLTSSWLMALALHSTRRKKIFFLGGTFFLGLLFLGLKFYEYFLHAKEGIFPGFSVGISEKLNSGQELFMNLYVLGTGLHALHMIFGLIALASLLTLFYFHRDPTPDALERMGLYWHFVDLVWLFLFPLFYLLGVSK
jgi:cytochrome c oxidase subunit 3